MKLKKITINNFMPYKGVQEIDFPQHETRNVMIVFGENMRGKTSFLNAIRWGFYGVAIGRHLRCIAKVNLINIEAAEENNWKTSVKLEFYHQKRNYELIREIVKKAHVSNPKINSDFQENVGLKIDGQSIKSDVIANTINQVIPEEISRFFLFDGELLQEYENLLIEDSEQGEKIKKHIEQVLGVPALINGKNEFGGLLKSAIRIQTKDAMNNKEAKSLALEQDRIDVELATSEKDHNELLSQKSTIQNKIDDIEDELKDQEAYIRRKEKLTKLESELTFTEQQLLTINDNQRDLLRTVWQDVLCHCINPIVSELENQRDKIQDSISSQATLENEIKHLTTNLSNPTCHTCKQKIPEDKIINMQEDLKELKIELEKSNTKIEDLNPLYEKLNKLSKIRSSNESKQICSLVDKRLKLQVQRVKIDSSIDEIKDEIQGRDTEAIMLQRDKRDRFIAQLGKLNGDMEKCEKKIQSNISRQNEIATLISKNEGNKSQLSSIRVSLYQKLETIFSKSINQLRDSVKNQVAEFASIAFRELTTEKTYSGLKINNNYGLSIIDKEGREVKERSAGAEQIVALSLIDGLNRTARKTGPIIMDTPLGRLDLQHRSNVLKYLPKMAEQVVLLVHEGEIDPNKDLENIVNRIGVRYQIKRISANESQITKVRS